MQASDLHVVAVRSNPLRWNRPDAIARDWIAHMLDSGVKLTIAEVAYGERPYAYADIPHVNHVPLRARTWCWSKENALNLAIQRIDAHWICWSDTDIFHRRPSWAVETVEALQHYDVVQPWDKALDLGPNDELIQVHHSFCSLFHQGQPINPEGRSQFWRFDGGCYDYAHSGYVWAATRQALEWTGGLFELGGMGSGDHHMALALAGKAAFSLPANANPSYARHLMQWQERAVRHINGNIGYVPGTIEHRFHGRKADRGYLSRWDMFIRHGFDPDTDLKRNSYGVFEWAGNKPELRREFDLYLRSRNEDINAL